MEVNPINSVKSASHSLFSRHSSSATMKRTKEEQCSNNSSYFQFVVSLFLIAFGQNGFLTSGVLSFHGKSTVLTVLTIGLIFATVGANSEITEYSSNTRYRLHVNLKFLQILPNGTISGTDDENSIYTVFQRNSTKPGQVLLKGAATCRFICMNSCGMIYSSKNFKNACLFHEHLTSNHYNIYSSVRWSKKKKILYIGLANNGKPRKVETESANLGKLNRYAQVLPEIAPSLLVEKLKKETSQRCIEDPQLKKIRKQTTGCPQRMNKRRRVTKVPK